jgi:hypothetical protein
MRLALVLFCLSAAAAYAGPMDTPATASPYNANGVYQPYRPAATPSPTPVQSYGISAAHYEVYKDTMSVDLKLGVALPMGDLAANNNTGWSGGLGLVYGASSLVDGAFEISYASMPYKLTVSAEPQTSLGVGVKAILKVLKDQQLSVNIEGGLGYYFEHVAVDEDAGPSPINPAIRLTVPGYKDSSGMGFTLGLAICYQWTPNFAVQAVADATQVNLDGGTGDTPLYMTPSLNLKYTF